LTVSLDFLTPGAYSVRLYRDGASGKKIAVERLNIKTAEGYKAAMAAQRRLCPHFSKSKGKQNCLKLVASTLNLRGEEDEAR
jgi:hypothetical protein